MAYSDFDEPTPRPRKTIKLVRAWRALMQLADGIHLADATNVVVEPRNIALGEHDVILIEVPGVMSHSSAEHMRDHIKRIWPRHEVLIMGEDMKLRVVERDMVNAVAARLVQST